MSQPNQGNDDNRINNTQSDTLEQGDIYFFYRPKKDAEQVKSIEDIRRFFIVTAAEQRQQEQQQENISSQIYRLFVIGKKSLPEIRKSEARASERYWARVGGIFTDPNELTKELFSDEFRKGDAARPVGEGKYAIVKHHNHAELAYILEMPKEPGEAQKELGIEKEASYIVSVINPKKSAASAVPEGGSYPSTEEIPMYPEEILKEFNDSDIFVSLTRDTRFIDYRNAQILLIGAREGRDIIKHDIGIEISDEEETQQSADIFTKLKVRKDQVPIKPLIEGKLE
ncbi:MAG TPA: hypothetical protein VFJ51_09875 [Nitrososphaeraceae archaeon]|nr:hypothetical protein [Nitrososphaeraceae archaeon]